LYEIDDLLIAMDFVLVMGWIWGWVVGYCFIENCT